MMNTSSIISKPPSIGAYAQPPQLSEQEIGSIEVLKNWVQDRNHSRSLGRQVLLGITGEKAFSEYVQRYLYLLFFMVGEILLENPKLKIGSEEHKSQMIDKLDHADIYRGFYIVDTIRLPPEAKPYLDCFLGSHTEVLLGLAKRFILNQNGETIQRVIIGGYRKIKHLPEANETVKEIRTQIEYSVKAGQDVRSYTPDELRNIDKNFSAIIASMREVDGNPFTYNGMMLLTGAWDLAFELFKEEDTSKDKDDPGRALLEKATQRHYYERFYLDLLVLGETASAFHKFLTLSTFSDQRQLLFKQQKSKQKDQPNDKERGRNTTRNPGGDSEASEKQAITRIPPVENETWIVTRLMEGKIITLIGKARRWVASCETKEGLAHQLSEVQSSLESTESNYERIGYGPWVKLDTCPGRIQQNFLHNTLKCLGSVLALQVVAANQTMDPKHVKLLKDLKGSLDDINDKWKEGGYP